jgi:hypothetical protein
VPLCSVQSLVVTREDLLLGHILHTFVVLLVDWSVSPKGPGPISKCGNFLRSTCLALTDLFLLNAQGYK